MRKCERVAVEKLSRRAAGIVFGVVSLPLYAQSAINLPAQPLAATLVQLQREAGVNIIAPSNVIGTRSAPAVSGAASVQEALGKVLATSGLHADQVDAKTFVIKLPPPVPASASAQPAARNEDRGTEDDPKQIASVTITGLADTGDSGFVSRRSGTATRSDTPISETPMSIQVVNQEMLLSQQAKTVSDALGYMSGISISETGEGSPTVYIRGRAASTLTNGLGDSGRGNALQNPMASIERIEVIKGGASILSGTTQPGGAVNVELKQPTADTVREVTGQVGNYGNVLGAIDLGGALSDDKRLTYRLIVSGEHNDKAFGDYDGAHAFYVAPSIGWKSGNTEVVLAYSHQYGRTPVSPVTLLETYGPLSFEGRATPLANSTLRQDNTSLTFKQRINSILEFESKTQYQQSIREQGSIYTLYGGFDGMGIYYGNDASSSYHSIATDNLFRLTLKLGDVGQTLVAGFAYNRDSFISSSSDLVYLEAPFPLPSAPPVPGPMTSFPGSTYFSNAYLQDQLTWGRLHVLAGVGYGSAYGGNIPRQSKWSPTFGALFDVTKTVGVYVNAMKSFEKGTGQLADLSIAPPSSGTSVEAGVKVTTLGGKLTVSGDVFRSQLNNMLIFDGATFLPTLADGAFKYSGAELDVVGQLTRGLNATMSYTYTHIDEPTSLDPRAMPLHTATAWLNYELQDESWRGWGGGIGLQARGPYWGSTTLQERGKVPGQMKTDLTIYYNARTWSATLGVKNLFDRTLYQPMGSVRVALAPDRMIYLTGKYNF